MDISCLGQTALKAMPDSESFPLSTTPTDAPVFAFQRRSTRSDESRTKLIPPPARRQSLRSVIVLPAIVPLIVAAPQMRLVIFTLS
jgi:hypothetical protein